MAGWIEGLAVGWLAIFFGVGVVLLVFGGDGLCRGAVHLARALRIPPVIIGLTVVSIATSMPELFTSLFGALRGSGSLAVGNIIGSNIGNVGLILGVAALLCPLTVRSRLVRRDVPILIVVTIIFLLLAWKGFNRVDGIVLLALCVGYFAYLVKGARKGILDAPGEIDDPVHSLWGAVAWVVGGAIALAVGADCLVGSAVGIARKFGVTEVVIGLTVVAIGTSLPELAAAVAAAVKKEADLCAGNIIGSNLFNLILVGGAVAVVSPLEVEAALFYWELPVMFLLTLILWPFFWTGKVVSRPEGAILITLYVAFLAITVWLRVN